MSAIEINREPEPATGFVICIPVFNDWDCVLRLLKDLDQLGKQFDEPVRVVLVDDGSTEPAPSTLAAAFTSIRRIEVLSLRRNVGHQRAITLGLAFINEHRPCRMVVVMDGDGEDSPHDINALVAKCRQSGCREIVFAQRRKRAEGIVFRCGYFAFKVGHLILTGRKVKVGNFSVIPHSLLERVVGVSELWNHYAAGILHARLPVATVPIDRAQRIMGRSKMNLVAMVTHGMSAISVYGDIVGVRLLCLTALLTVFVLAGLASVVIIRVFTDLAIPGWAAMAFGILSIILINLVMLAMVFVLFLLQSRSMGGFLPVRDWKDYVISQRVIHDSGG
jgi:glycosyltransferase involved in cell wall biosynthesis